MSRFGDGRGQRVAVWSAAALAWGSTVTAVVLEPVRGGADAAPVVNETESQPALPNQPSTGVIVIRYQRDTVDPTPDAAPAQADAPAPAPQPPPPPPQPASSGS